MSCRLLSSVLCALACLVIVQNVPARPGDLDPSFGNGGVARIPSDVLASTTVRASARQADGKLVVVGETREAPSSRAKPVIGRFNVDGTSDASFGTSGWVVIDNPQANAYDGQAIAIATADQKVVVAVQWPLVSYVGIMKLMDDGTPDPEFFAADPLAGNVARAFIPLVSSIAVRDDGKIATASDAPLIVSTFDTSGFQQATYFDYWGIQRAGALLWGSDGSIFVAGTDYESGGPNRRDFRIAKFAPDGSPDSAFGQAGSVAVDFTQGNDEVFVLRADAQGRLLAAGAAGWQYNDGAVPASGFGVARLDPVTGALDPTFGEGGKLQLDVIVDGGDRLAEQSDARSIEFAGNGDILAAGQTTTVGAITRRPVLARLDADGNPLLSFGNLGVVLESSASNEGFVGVTISSDAVVAVGDAHDGTTQRGTVVRHRYLEGTGTAGEVLSSSGPSTLSALAVQFAVAPDGSVVTVGRAGDSTRVMRLSADGNLMSGWGSDGKIEFNDGASQMGRSSGKAVAFDPNGRILVGSQIESPGLFGGAPQTRWSVKRLNADGSTDTTFGNGDASADRVHDLGFVAALPNGKVVAAGGPPNLQGSDGGVEAARFNDDGTLDDAFGSSGVVRFSGGGARATAFAVTPVGDLIAMTYFGQGNSFILPFSPNGDVFNIHQFDGLFDPPHALKALPDGDVIVAGRCIGEIVRPCAYRLGYGSGDFRSYQLPDAVGAHLTGVEVQIDNRILAAGDFLMDSPVSMRFNREGTPDPLYNISNASGYKVIEGVAGDGWKSVVANDGVVSLLSYSLPEAGNEEVLVARLQGVDFTPDPFSFGAVNDAPLDTLVSTPPTSIGGFDDSAPISIVNGEYSTTCSEPYTSQPGEILSGQILCVRHRTAATEGTTRSTVLTVGKGSATFTSTTGITPDTSITAAPPPVTAALTYVFEFTATQPNATFECRLDGYPLRTCSSPVTLGRGEDGLHEFSVAARTAAGLDQTPAVAHWRIDTTPPDTTIVSGPSDKDKKSPWEFVFSSNEAEATFECSLDGAPYVSCSANTTFVKLSHQAHSLAVRARDAAGNVDPTPATWSWKAN